jgi:hypothetical protein
VVFAVGLGVWGASLFWPHNPLRVLGFAVLFGAGLLALATLALGIGVRFPHRSWMAGVLVANVLQAATVARVVDWGPPASGSGQAALGFMMVFLFNLLVMVAAAAAGVGWGKLCEGADG